MKYVNTSTSFISLSEGHYVPLLLLQNSPRKVIAIFQYFAMFFN